MQIASGKNFRSLRNKGRGQYGVVQKKPFDWGRFWRRILRGIRFIFLLLLLGAIVVGPYFGWQYLKKNNTFFKIETVSVYGDIEYLPSSRINDLVKGAVGQNLIGLDMQNYQDQILEEHWIKSVHLKRQWLHELEVHLVEERPIAIWNLTKMIDADGEIFEPSFIPEQEWVSLEGPDDKAQVVLDAYEKVSTQLARSGFKLQKLVLDENGSWAILLDNDLWLVIGTEELQDRLMRFLKQFPDRKVLEAIQQIDLRYKNGFSVKWRENL